VSRRSECNRVAEDRWVPFVTTDAFVVIDGPTPEKQRKFPEADADLKRVLAAFPHTNAKTALGELYAVSGKKAEARKIAQELQENSKKEYVAPYWLATIYAALGDKDTAFRLLETAFAERSSWILDLKVDPRFAALRTDVRFQDLLRP
jgi:tetratricopeptide (TPR) repeat protein